jgi:hypothetical protein
MSHKIFFLFEMVYQRLNMGKLSVWTSDVLGSWQWTLIDLGFFQQQFFQLIYSRSIFFSVYKDSTTRVVQICSPSIDIYQVFLSVYCWRIILDLFLFQKNNFRSFI